jgi:hypothetical protein
MADSMIDLAKVAVLAIVAVVFLYGLKKDWEGVFLIFGLILMLGSCKMLGI